MKHHGARRLAAIAKRDPVLLGCIAACIVSVVGVVLVFWLS